jgi:hypothetical protein
LWEGVVKGQNPKSELFTFARRCISPSCANVLLKFVLVVVRNRFPLHLDQQLYGSAERGATKYLSEESETASTEGGCASQARGADHHKPRMET